METLSHEIWDYEFTNENSGGSRLPEDKKVICGTEGEIVVAHGRLPFPAPWTQQFNI